MPDVPTPSEVGFADFVASLIADVFDAVLGSQIAQDTKLAELQTLAELSLEAFADQVVSDDDVTDELARLFPDPSSEHGTSVYAGAPYRRATGEVSEDPPVESVLGLRLQRGDFAAQKGGMRLTSRGVERIRSRIGERLADEQLAVVRHLVRRGLPQVIVDSGKVNSKLTYQVTQSTDEADTAGPVRPARPPVAPGVPLAKWQAMKPVQLTVRPADERSPQNQDLRVNVFGEVEISFKAVT